MMDWDIEKGIEELETYCLREGIDLDAICADASVFFQDREAQ